MIKKVYINFDTWPGEESKYLKGVLKIYFLGILVWQSYYYKSKYQLSNV